MSVGHELHATTSICCRMTSACDVRSQLLEDGGGANFTGARARLSGKHVTG